MAIRILTVAFFVCLAGPAMAQSNFDFLRPNPIKEMEAEMSRLRAQVERQRDETATLQSQQIWADRRAEKAESERFYEKLNRQLDDNIRSMLLPKPAIPPDKLITDWASAMPQVRALPSVGLYGGDPIGSTRP